MERLTVSLNAVTELSMNKIVNHNDINKTDAINKSLQVYAYLIEMMEQGYELNFTRNDESLRVKIL